MSEVGKRVTRGALRKNLSEENEARRKSHQQELMNSVLNDMRLHFLGKKSNADDTSKTVEARLSESYKSESSFPKESFNSIFLDKKNETIFIPICSGPLPLHLSYIKSASRIDEGQKTFLRINLHLPGKAEKSNIPFISEGHYLKEVSVLCKDIATLQNFLKFYADYKKEKTLKYCLTAYFSDASSNSAAEKTLPQFIANPRVLVSKDFILDDVYVRPSFPGRKYPGELQIHSNGLRYISSSKGDEQVLDIVFNNIKHLIFQSCEGESNVILHLNLFNSVMLGKKRTHDVQFYRDVLENSVEETSGRRKRINYTDEDEMLEEEEEIKRKEQADDDFENFGTKIAECSNGELAFECAERDTSFPGIIFRQNVAVRHTDESLVYVSETPFLVVSWADVEVAYLERVVFGLKNFDLVLVYREHSREPFHVNSIPVSFLETVKDILNDHNVAYAESTVNFNWPNIIKMIEDDPIEFYSNGGWKSLQPDDNGDTESEPESEYEEDSEAEDASDDDDEFSNEPSEDDSEEETNPSDAPSGSEED